MKKFRSLIVKSSCLVITIFLGISFSVSATRFRNKENSHGLPKITLSEPMDSIPIPTFLVVNENDINCIVSREISNGDIIHINSYGTKLIVDKVIIDEFGNEYFFYKLGYERQRFEEFLKDIRSKKVKFSIKYTTEEYILSLFGK